jgi:MFS family permease
LTALSSIAALLLSVVLLIGGSALVGVTTPLRARIDGFPDLTVGLLGSAYFAGMLAGTLAAPVVIRRGGHIRAFAAFVALAVVSVVLMPVFASPWAWLLFRALIGFVFAGIYAVIEAWINAKATNSNRGALYALYQIANFTASAGGQMMLQPLGPNGFAPFAAAGALLALAILPMAMTSVLIRRPSRAASDPACYGSSAWHRSPVSRFSRRGRPTALPSRSARSSPSGSACRRTIRRSLPRPL